MSQAALGGAVGVTSHAVYLWESGRRHPSPENVEALAAALEVEVAELYGGAPPPERPARRLPRGLQDMIVQGLAEVPPTEEDIEELLEIP